MADPRFYDNCGPLTLSAIETLTGAKLFAGDRDQWITDVAMLERAQPGDLAFSDSDKRSVREQLAAARATAVLVTEAVRDAVPAGTLALVVARPALAFAKVSAALYPDAALTWPRAHPPVVFIDPTATIGERVVIAPGAFIGYGAEVGSDTLVASGAVIGRGVRIGENCRIGANVSLSHSLIGNRVTIYPGSCIGQDGFGFVPSARGHQKIPQLGRVVIHDDVEIGANATIDRGMLGDTEIGEGTKIDNLVQLAHNSRIGRHCVLAGQVGISGSVTLGDFVVLGGQVGVGDHIEIGSGARVAGKGGVTHSLEGGGEYGGYPARPAAQWRREMAVLARMAKKKREPPA